MHTCLCCSAKCSHAVLPTKVKLLSESRGRAQLFWFVPTGEVLRNTLAPAAAQVAAASMPAGRRLHAAGEGKHDALSACESGEYVLSIAAQHACAGRAARSQLRCL